MLRAACSSFRAISTIFQQFVLHGKLERAPEPETLIQWEMKLGLHKLQRPKAANEEWTWLADHVIRLGRYKCLVIVGVRTAVLRKRGNLTVSLEDLEPMTILPMTESNGSLVANKLEETMTRVGFAPKSLVIDHGSDLRAGAALSARSHPGMRVHCDVAHKVACEIKRRLDTDSWMIMMGKAAETRKSLILSKCAQFAPPNQRVKARYMNLDTLVNWGCNTLKDYAGLPQEVREKTSWLLPLHRDLLLWQEWVQVGKITRDVIRTEGFYEGVEVLLMDRIIGMNLSKESEELTEVLVDYVQAEGAGIAYDARVVGTTESLEGLFGGYKRMVGENRMSANGLGRLILCMSSRTGELSETLTREAMTHVRCRDVRSWLTQAFGSGKSIFGREMETSTQRGCA